MSWQITSFAVLHGTSRPFPHERCQDLDGCYLFMLFLNVSVPPIEYCESGFLCIFGSFGNE